MSPGSALSVPEVRLDRHVAADEAAVAQHQPTTDVDDDRVRGVDVILRPPFSHARVTLTESGRVRLRLKRPWADGTTHLVFGPLDFIARLVPLIPPPRTHRTRYQGILASHHRLRSVVVPQPPAGAPPTQLHLWRDRGKRAPAPKHRIEWQRLMARTLGVDPLECPNCRRQMRIVAFVTRPQSIAYHLHL